MTCLNFNWFIHFQKNKVFLRKVKSCESCMIIRYFSISQCYFFWYVLVICFIDGNHFSIPTIIKTWNLTHIANSDCLMTELTYYEDYAFYKNIFGRTVSGFCKRKKNVLNLWYLLSHVFIILSIHWFHYHVSSTYFPLQFLWVTAKNKDYDIIFNTYCKVY